MGIQRHGLLFIGCAIGIAHHPRAGPPAPRFSQELCGAALPRLESACQVVKNKERKEEASPLALNIKSPEAERLARVLAEKTGETITETITKALRQRLAREQGRTALPSLKDELLAIAKRCARLRDRDTRSPEDILGYDKSGLPR